VTRPLHVLIVEDSVDDTELICLELHRGGYEPRAQRVETASQMAAALGLQDWDLVISDHSMPKFDAPQALRLLQASGQDLPFIIVSGSINEEVAVAAMKAGAHDFVTKDHLRRLIPAVGRELREAEMRRQRRRAEKALQEAESRYQDLYENAPDMCVSVDATNLRVVQCNRTLERMIGFTKEEIIGRSILDMFQRDYRDRVEEVWRQFQGTGEVRDAELKLLRKDGSAIDISVNVTAVCDDHGRILRSRSVWRDITERKHSERQLQEQAERLQMLSRRLLDAQELERRAVARELHDEIGQVLTAVKLSLQAIAHRLQPAAEVPELADSIEIVEHAIQLVRNRSMDLRPALLDDFGLVPAIRWYLERHAAHAKFVIELSADPLMARSPPAVETACFRVIQEAVTNAMRHSGAKTLHIEIRHEDSGLRCAILDDGVGFDVDGARQRALAGGSIGLAGMQERVEFLGGSLEIESWLGQGTRIGVLLPLTAAVAAA
jgi:two-component system, NarL family, sensor histidine kinase UhpB